MISAGTLRTKVIRLAAPTGQDAVGMRNTTFTQSGFFWGGFRATSVSEQAYADGVVVRRICEIRARWADVQQSGLTEVDRVLVNGRTLKVTAIENLDEADRVAVISAEEIV